MTPRRLTVLALVLAALGLAPSRASAGPSASRFLVTDRGDAVDVVIPGATAATLTAEVVRQRLEVPLRGRPEGREVRPGDPTVKSIEIRGRSQRILSIKLFVDHDAVVALAPRVRLQQEGDALRVTIPRSPPPPPAPAPAPTPTPTATTPTAVASITPPVAPTAPLAPASTTEHPGATVMAAAPPTALAAAATTAAAPASAPGAPAASALASPRGGSGGVPTTTLVVVLAALAIGAVAVLRRRRTSPLATTSLDVLASRSLGGKARVVWLAAGEREMVVAVTGQNVQILGQWRAGAGAALGPTARGTRDLPLVDDEAPAGSAAAAGRDELGGRPHLSLVGPGRASAASSPAVSGILRLRERLGQLTAADREPSGDPEADEQWAKEILAATGGRR